MAKNTFSCTVKCQEASRWLSDPQGLSQFQHLIYCSLLQFGSSAWANKYFSSKCIDDPSTLSFTFLLPEYCATWSCHISINLPLALHRYTEIFRQDLKSINWYFEGKPDFSSFPVPFCSYTDCILASLPFCWKSLWWRHSPPLPCGNQYLTQSMVFWTGFIAHQLFCCTVWCIRLVSSFSVISLEPLHLGISFSLPYTYSQLQRDQSQHFQMLQTKIIGGKSAVSIDSINNFKRHLILQSTYMRR